MKNSIVRFCKAWLPPLLWAGFIFFLSSQSSLPKLEETLFDYVFKKSAHIFVYAVLYALVWRAIRFYSEQKHRAITLILPLAITILYAISDEFHQSTVVGRTASIKDVGYDFLGAIFSLILVRKHN